MAKIDNDAGFIWSAADLRRGEDGQSEYGKAVLPLTPLCSSGAVVCEAAPSGRASPCDARSAYANEASATRVPRGRRSLTPTLAIPAVRLTAGSQRGTHRCCSRVGTCTAELGHDGIDYLYELRAVEPFAGWLANENRARNLATLSELLNVFQRYYHYSVVTR